MAAAVDGWPLLGAGRANSGSRAISSMRVSDKATRGSEEPVA